MSLRRLAELTAFSSLRQLPLTTLDSAISGLGARLESAVEAGAARHMSAMAFQRHRTAAGAEVRTIATCDARAPPGRRVQTCRVASSNLIVFERRCGVLRSAGGGVVPAKKDGVPIGRLRRHRQTVRCGGRVYGTRQRVAGIHPPAPLAGPPSCQETPARRSRRLASAGGHAHHREEREAEGGRSGPGRETRAQDRRC